MVFIFTSIIGIENTILNLIHFLKHENLEYKFNLLLSKKKYQLILYYIPFSICVLISLLFIILKYSDVIIHNIFFYTKDLMTSTIKCINNLCNKYNIQIILLPLLATIYFAIKLPINCDEAWTYLNFSSKSFIIPLIHYPLPNNHILHSIITNISNSIFPDFPLLSLRLPSIFISVIIYSVVFYSIKKHYSHRIAIVSVGILSVLFMDIYYSYMSRGYSLILLFFLISFHFALNLIKYSDNIRDWVWFTIFSILGFYTMPSYLYAFVILNIVILSTNFTKITITKQIKYTLITIISVLLLYMPIVIISGLESLINNRFVTPISRNVVLYRLPEFLLKGISEIFGINSLLLICFVIITLFLLVRYKNWFHIKLFLLFLILPSILLLAHSVIPFYRTFNYYGFILILFFSISIKFLLDEIAIKYIVIIVIFLQIFFINNFNNIIFTYEKNSIRAKNINQKIIGYENCSYLLNSVPFSTFLFYYLKTGNILNYKIDYKPEINMNTDTITKYNYIIIDKSLDKTVKNKPIYTNESYNVYKNDTRTK